MRRFHRLPSPWPVPHSRPRAAVSTFASSAQVPFPLPLPPRQADAQAGGGTGAGPLHCRTNTSRSWYLTLHDLLSQTRFKLRTIFRPVRLGSASFGCAVLCGGRVKLILRTDRSLSLLKRRHLDSAHATAQRHWLLEVGGTSCQHQKPRTTHTHTHTHTRLCPLSRDLVTWKRGVSRTS